MDVIDTVITDECVGEYISLKDRVGLRQEIYDSIKGMDILDSILQDENSGITEIMINGPDNIFVEKNGRIEKYSGSFNSKERLSDVIQRMVSSVNRRVNEASPIVDSRLKDGSRVNVVLDPVALDGPVVTIRKFPSERMTMSKLCDIDALTVECRDFLKVLVEAKYNIVISGGTGAGKTTFLNALSNYIPEGERVITIEDSAELQIQNVPNLVRLEARAANEEGANQISISDSIQSSLRMRPDRIIVGEVRDGAALDMLQAMNTGHDGSLSTGHANGTRDILRRLETMTLMSGVDLPVSAIRGQIATGVDIIIHLGRLRDGSRKVLEVAEVLDVVNDKIEIRPLFVFKEDTSTIRDSRVKGNLEWTKKGLINVRKLEFAGFYEESKKYGQRT